MFFGVPAVSLSPGAEADIDEFSDDSVSFTVGDSNDTPSGMFVKSDGTKFYILLRDFSASDTVVQQYSMSTAWDLSTASYDSVDFSVASESTNDQGLTMLGDGSKFYMASGAEVVYQYSMGTPWDLSTASYDTVSFDASTDVTGLADINIKPDGTKMYMADVIGVGNSHVRQYTLVTPGNISTASYDNKSLDVSSQEDLITAVFLSNDGKKLFAIGSQSDTLFQYDLSTAWDISTGSYSGKSLAIDASQDNAISLYFRDDLSRFYFLSDTGRNMYQYSS